jgi:heme-degrading monooxygenase HmoA
MPVRSIITFDTKAGQEERFKAEFHGLRAAIGFPGFLGGEFIQSTTNPRIFIATALWENRAAYAAWQAQGASLKSGPPERMTFLAETLVEIPWGTPYDVVDIVPAT